jgi:bacterioferritin
MDRGKGMDMSTTGLGILDDANEARREEIIALLTTAYWMEVETVMSYIQASANLEGVDAREISGSLEADIADEIAHAQLFAARIHQLGGVVPGSKSFRPSQDTLQAPPQPTDIAYVIDGVIDAERGAVEHYTRIIEACEGIDPVTADMLTTILADEQGHMRLFQGFKRGYEVRAGA